jgi:hypothetical protein
MVYSLTCYTDLSKALFTFKTDNISRYTPKYDFIYGRKKTTAFRPPIFMKLKNALYSGLLSRILLSPENKSEKQV